MSFKDWLPGRKDEFEDDSGLKLDELKNDNEDPFKENMETQDPFSQGTDSFGNKKVPFKASSGDVYEEERPASNASTNVNDLILSKLDTIKAELNNVNHRLEKLENKKKEKLW